MSGQAGGVDGEDGRRLVELVKDGRKIEAIKLVREVTGCGLKEGKDAVEKLERELAPGQPPVPRGKEADDEIRRLLREDRKIEAIKVYREATGCGLKEAKDAVERIAAES